MSTADPFRLSEHAGRVHLFIPESIAPRRMLGALCSGFGAAELSCTKDPLGDWIDVRLSISGHELTLSAAYDGSDLWAASAGAGELLRQIAGPLAAALACP